MASTKKITLKSSDGETFDVDEAVALQSQIIKHVIEDGCADNGIPLPNVTGKILAKVIEYCKKHVEMPKDRATEDELRAWDTEFLKIDRAVLFDLILAADYLNIKSLLDLTHDTVADVIKGKTPEELSKTFNIKIDFIPEEEEEVRRAFMTEEPEEALRKYPEAQEKLWTELEWVRRKLRELEEAQRVLREWEEVLRGLEEPLEKEEEEEEARRELEEARRELQRELEVVQGELEELLEVQRKLEESWRKWEELPRKLEKREEVRELKEKSRRGLEELIKDLAAWRKLGDVWRVNRWGQRESRWSEEELRRDCPWAFR